MNYWDFLMAVAILAAILCGLGVVGLIIRLIAGPTSADIDDDESRWWWSIK